ncbi:uncharacterized protein LOC114815932 [Ornithorhynchus anatinus]|uniref:uncharacterized protein LOC114815932 n=1 Tax=Ornithorhynchus anatinus TaxID=9258 RepID=UPI0019D4373D|nr:uncharacterized protein LOC114815932 [Ornithorhynchus anatinus]
MGRTRLDSAYSSLDVGVCAGISANLSVASLQKRKKKKGSLQEVELWLQQFFRIKETYQSKFFSISEKAGWRRLLICFNPSEYYLLFLGLRLLLGFLDKPEVKVGVEVFLQESDPLCNGDYRSDWTQAVRWEMVQRRSSLKACLVFWNLSFYRNAAHRMKETGKKTLVNLSLQTIFSNPILPHGYLVGLRSYPSGKFWLNFIVTL